MTRRCWSSRCIIKSMEHDELNGALEEVQYLLERMLELAERSASGDCSDASRVRLQQGLEILREQIDRALERYQDH